MRSRPAAIGMIMDLYEQVDEHSFTRDPVSGTIQLHGPEAKLASLMYQTMPAIIRYLEQEEDDLDDLRVIYVQSINERMRLEDEVKRWREAARGE